MLYDDTLTFIDYFSKASPVVILIFILYGGYRRWWVFGWLLKESEERCIEVGKDRNEWKKMALKGTGLAEKALDQVKEN